jgi:integrase
MVTLSRLRNGRSYIQVRLSRHDRRRGIPLPRIPRNAAEEVRIHVEKLLMARRTNTGVPPGTALWVEGLGDDLHARLAALGFVRPRSTPPTHSLGAVVQGYIERRTDLKPRTVENLKQSKRALVAHFGAGRDLATITPGEAADWHRGLKKSYAQATVAMHVKKARQFFEDALDRRLITENPFRALKAGKQSNAERMAYVPVGDIVSVIEKCPDAEWKLILALARFGGLRVPSETRLLKWSDVDFEAKRMTVHSPKTEHHEGRASRIVPVFPLLEPYLRVAFDAAVEGAEHVVARHRGGNLRTAVHRFIRRAGLVPWAKTFQNLRSSCQTDLVSRFPLHVACAWIGNSQAVAAGHYLQVTEQHYADALGPQTASAAAGRVFP